MKFKTLTLLSFFCFCLFPFWAYAATYSYYFSSASTGNSAGNDATGDGSEGSPWASLSKAKSAINALASTDTVNLYFDRGDTWTWDSDKVAIQYSAFSVSTANPIVNIDAYGSGNLPVFDGTVTDFRLVPAHNASTGPLKWSRFFEFQRQNCSVSNVEIKGVYGHAIFLNNADGFLLSRCYIHDFGNSGLMHNYQYGVENSVVQYCVMHTGQELYRRGKISGWGGAIDFNGAGYGAASMCKNNHVHHNEIYNIFGEGISNSNGITEYNIVGNTGSVALNTSAHDYDTLQAIVRYNIVVFSDWEQTGYDNHVGGDRSGTRIYDERIGGDNSNGSIEIYGNLIINYNIGIRFYCTTYGDSECNNPYGDIKIFNNIVIDSHTTNFFMLNPGEANKAYFKNNSSILYDQTTTDHIQDFNGFPDANWEIEGNHFWTTGGKPAVDLDWLNKSIISDPLLRGEPTVDWDGQSGETFYKDINPIIHLNPTQESPIFGISPILTMDINDMMSTTLPGVPIKAPSEFGLVN